MRERSHGYDPLYVSTHNAALLSAVFVRAPQSVGLDTMNAEDAYRRSSRMFASRCARGETRP